jgi:hypothetical protein
MKSKPPYGGQKIVHRVQMAEAAYNRVPLNFLFRQLFEPNISPNILNWIYVTSSSGK